MDDPRRLLYRRPFKKPVKLWQAALLFAVLFIICFAAWSAQDLGYWPENWTVNPRIEGVSHPL